MLRVSNIAHLLTKPDQVAKAERLERKPKQLSIKSSTSPKPKRNKIKKSKLAYWLSYSEAAITSPLSVQYCQISIILDSGCLLTTMSSGISSVTHHRNPHINAIFVDLFMQKLFVYKIHFFKFLCMSGKPRLHQLNIITSSRSRCKLPLLPEFFFSYGEIPSRKRKYPMLITNTKTHHLIKHAKIFYSIISLVFRKFRTEPTEMV